MQDRTERAGGDTRLVQQSEPEQPGDAGAGRYRRRTRRTVRSYRESSVRVARST